MKDELREESHVLLNGVCLTLASYVRIYTANPHTAIGRACNPRSNLERQADYILESQIVAMSAISPTQCMQNELIHTMYETISHKPMLL